MTGVCLVDRSLAAAEPETNHDVPTKTEATTEAAVTTTTTTTTAVTIGYRATAEQLRLCSTREAWQRCSLRTR